MPDPDPYAAILNALTKPGRPTSDFDLNPDSVRANRRTLRPAAVLVAFESGPDGLRVILTKRASHLKHHPGQIAFPGGKVEEADHSVVATALREAQEEIGLDPKNVTILGTTEPHETVTAFQVTPVFARIAPGFCPVPQDSEVEEVFSVPFAHLADPANYRIEGRLWRGARRRYYVVPYGPYYIWGATARILRALADRMG